MNMSHRIISEYDKKLALFLSLTVIWIENFTCLHAFPSPENVLLTADKNPAPVGENVKLTCNVPDGQPIYWITIHASNSRTSDYSTCYHDGKFISGGRLRGRTFSTCQANLTSGVHLIEFVATKSMECTCEVYYSHPLNQSAGVVSARQPLFLQVTGEHERIRREAMTEKKTKWNALVLECTNNQSSLQRRKTSYTSYKKWPPECEPPPTELQFKCYKDESRYEIYLNNTSLAVCEKPLETLKFHNESDVQAMKVDISASTCSICRDRTTGNEYNVFTLVPSDNDNRDDWFFEKFKKEHNKVPANLKKEHIKAPDTSQNHQPAVYLWWIGLLLSFYLAYV